MEEERRLDEPASNGWKTWGPYLSERQWGTVREDYSPGGTAWEAFSHDAARSRAYRWGEDGLFGISDDQQILCFALALWNGRDPILKERLFGLTNSEGNHGEDVKECYYYLDATPTHSYLKGLYKYPQRRVSVRAARRGEPPARQGRSGIRADRHRRVRGQPLLRRGHRVREALGLGHLHPRSPCTTAARKTADVHLLPQLVVPQHLVVGLSGSQARAGVGRRRRLRRERGVGDVPAVSRGRAPLALHRERDQRPPPVRIAGSPAVISRTRFTSTSSKATQARSTRAGAGPRLRRTTVSRFRRAATPASACACPPAPTTIRSPASTASSTGVVERPTISTTAFRRPSPRISGSCSGRRWPA